MTGEIVHTPAYFSTTYSICFDVHGTPVTLHRINRHEFHLLDDDDREIEPGLPPADRFPQPPAHRHRPGPADRTGRGAD
jgi:hypothetical protein